MIKNPDTDWQIEGLDHYCNFALVFVFFFKYYICFVYEVEINK